MKRSQASINNLSISTAKKSNKTAKAITAKATNNPLKSNAVKTTSKSAQKTQKNRSGAGQKTSNASSKKNTSSKKTFWIVVGIACLGILIACILLWSAWPKQKSSANISDSSVLVSVNDVPITKSTFNFQYNLLPETYRQTFTNSQVLEQIIDEELVVQAAKKSGITATPQEVNERIQKVLANSGISIGDLQANLDHYNITAEQFESLINRQILIERYLQNKIVDSPIDDSAAKASYDASKEKYSVSEQVTVRHILISIQRTDAAVIAKKIYDDVIKGADFCKYVTNSSDDKGSRDKCGQYTFPKGFMVPEFEKASFDMKPGEFRMIQTSFGYHIINKINSTSASIKPYESVKADIVAQLQSIDRAQQYRTIVDNLRSQATIKYANGTVIIPNNPSSIGVAYEVNQVVVANNNNNTNNNAINESNSTNNANTNVNIVNTALTNGAANANGANGVGVVKAQSDAQPSVPLATGDATVGGTINNATNNNNGADNSLTNNGTSLITQQKLSCIAKNATLYGTSWSSDSQSARNLFSQAGIALNYVDCSINDCKTQGIIAYPTWKIDGTIYMGAMTVEQLLSAANC